MIAFESFAQFLAMGGHGLYVWSTYGICMALMVWTAVLPVLARRRYLKDLDRRRRREAL